MTFVTLTFLLFLAIVFGLYWGCRARLPQNVLLVVASYVFYGWWDWRFCGLLLASSLVDYFVGLGLNRAERASARRALLVVSLVANLGLLGSFKYFNFFADSLHALLTSLGWHVQEVELRVILPVGISFYTFQTLSYTIDVYRRRMRATGRLVDYLAFVSFFPQLVAGPIERARDLLPQLMRPRRFDESMARDGLRQILWGFFKKMVIADNLAVLVDAAFADPSGHSGPVLFIALACFAFQLYCDFSGYSDIAIGAAKLFGIRLTVNFAYPYFSQSMPEVWRRWHISLSTWFRDYLFFPLGGRRRSPLRRAAALVITFALIGLWHGASWNFVLWGTLQGLVMLPAMLWPARRRRAPANEAPGGEHLVPAPAVLGRMVLTFSLVALILGLFRTATLGDAAAVYQRLALDFWRPDAWAVWPEAFGGAAGRQSLCHLALFILIEWLQRRREHALDVPWCPRPLRQVLYALIVWDILYYGTRTSDIFYYFQF